MTREPAPIIAFTRARLDEDEAMTNAAAAAAGPDWHHSAAITAHGPTTIVFADEDEEIEVLDTLRRDDEEIAPFAARNDPARALRQVAAGRRILARHHDDGHGYCAGCPRGEIQGDLETEIDDCPELRDLVSVWSDDPGYQQRWAS